MKLSKGVRGKSYLAVWWRLSRVPFLFVGILPLILGFALAWRSGHRAGLPFYGLAIMGVTLIMWMTYYIGEWNDLEGDRLNHTFNSFSGGTRVLVDWSLPVWVPLLSGYLCLALAIWVGLYIFFHYRTGPWTLPLGASGILAGLFYSNKPFRWAYRGMGEVLIGICYGWLPIATGTYLFTRDLTPQVWLLSVPVGFSIFNVIVINEFPDEEADRRIGKKNLLVRFGKERMANLYVGVSLLVGFSFVVVLLVQRSPFWLLFLSGIPFLLLFWNALRVLNGHYRNSKTLNSLCRNGLFINLSITLILIIQQMVK